MLKFGWPMVCRIILGIAKSLNLRSGMDKNIMQKGIVKWFNDSKGFGFISSQNQEYFVHFKEITSDGFKTLKVGQPVTFNPEKSAKGPIAKAVRVDTE